MTITYLPPQKVTDLIADTYNTLCKQPSYGILESIADTVGTAANMNHVISQIIPEAHELGFTGPDFVAQMNEMLNYCREKKGIGQRQV